MKNPFTAPLAAAFWLAAIVAVSAQDAPLRVCVSTTDLQSLAARLGGEHIRVFCFAKGPEDPHVIELLPSFVKEMQQAELFIQVGLGIENAWLKDLATRAANPRVAPGAPGLLNIGSGVRRLAEDDGADAVPGSFHEEGNPHYLLDPVEGLKASRLVRDKFSELRPAKKAAFAALHDAFVRAWAKAYLGEAAAARADIARLADPAGTDALESYLAELSRDLKPGDGVAGLLAPLKGTTVVGDHDLWPYFARRYQLNVLGYLEPSPGVPPTTKHLGELVGKMQALKVGLILTAPYFDQRHGRFVSARTGAAVVEMAHQCGGRRGTEDYLDMIRFNATQLAEAAKKGAAR